MENEILLKTNYKTKIELIKSTLENDIRIRKKIHHNYFIFYKRLNTIIKTIINTLNATSICSLILNYNKIGNNIALIIALSTTSISSIISVINTTIETDNKFHQHKISDLEYSNLYREITARILRNGLTSEDLDFILLEINDKISLIEDNSPPIILKKIKSLSNIVID